MTKTYWLTFLDTVSEFSKHIYGLRVSQGINKSISQFILSIMR